MNSLRWLVRERPSFPLRPSSVSTAHDFVLPFQAWPYAIQRYGEPALHGVATEPAVNGPALRADIHRRFRLAARRPGRCRAAGIAALSTGDDQPVHHCRRAVQRGPAALLRNQRPVGRGGIAAVRRQRHRGRGDRPGTAGVRGYPRPGPAVAHERAHRPAHGIDQARAGIDEDRLPRHPGQHLLRRPLRFGVVLHGGAVRIRPFPLPVRRRLGRGQAGFPENPAA